MLLSAGQLHADVLTIPAPPTSGSASPQHGDATRTSEYVPQDGGRLTLAALRDRAAALVRSVGQGVADVGEELLAEMVTTQLTMIGGHGTGKPKSTDTPPPPPPGGNNPPPPPPGGGGGGPDNNPPPPDNPPPPVTTGGPGTVNSSPEPASLVTAVVGAGLASFAAWRHRRRKRA
jgi:hypothetical protein